jgi:ABC-type lipoprotein export system ATPase subunit
MISIYANNLSKNYDGNIVFKNLSLEASSGDVLAVIGPSGSGKTTLLKILGLIMRPTSGELYINDINTQKISDTMLSEYRRRYAGYSFQEPIFIPSLNVLDNVLIPFYPYVSRNRLSEIKKDALKLFERLELSGLDKRKPSELSTGQRKRVDLARALIKNPGILIVDEPTANLDEESADIIREVIKEYGKKGKIVILAAHRDKKLFKLSNKRINITRFK